MFVLFKFIIINKVTFVFEQMSAIGSRHVSCPEKFIIYLPFVFILGFSPITFISWNNTLIAQIEFHFFFLFRFYLDDYSRDIVVN